MSVLGAGLPRCQSISEGGDGVEPTALQRHLFEKHRVCTVPVDQGGVRGIRVTPNVYTTLEEIDVFVRAVEEVLAKGLPGAEG